MVVAKIETDNALAIFKSVDNSPDGLYKPCGLFYIEEKDDHFTAIDNQDGYAWCEEFSSREEMFKWFMGEEAVDAHKNILNS